MKNWTKTGIFQIGLLLFTFCDLRLVSGFQQEMIVFWEEPHNNNGHGQKRGHKQHGHGHNNPGHGKTVHRQRFTDSVPDSRIFPWYHKVSRICLKGVWNCFRYPGFNGTLMGYGMRGLPDHPVTDKLGCESFRTWAKSVFPSVFPCESFRAEGTPETELNAVSLYTEEDAGGQEFVVNSNISPAVNNVPQYFGAVKSIAWTGRASWTLFEQPDFGGFAVCLNPLEQGYPAKFGSIVRDIDLETVGSVLVGCDPKHFNLNLQNALPTLKRKFQALGSTLEGVVEGGWNVLKSSVWGGKGGKECGEHQGIEVCS